MSNNVAAIFCADLHLSDKPPVARSAEPDWKAAMTRQLAELNAVKLKYGDARLFVAGDLFDRWNPTVELVSFALEHLPDGMVCIPGNHDLPYHDLTAIKRSAFWTLVQAGKITYTDKSQLALDKLVVHMFPCGREVVPCKRPHSLCLDIALIHAYIWKQGCGYENAPENARIKNWDKRIRGYDIAVFGDNHTPFDFLATNEGQVAIYNCGGFFRRRSDEVNHRPSVALLFEDGTTKRHYLDCSQDKFLPDGELVKLVEKAVDVDLSKFVDELAELSDRALDFRGAVLCYLENNNMGSGVKQAVLKALGG